MNLQLDQQTQEEVNHYEQNNLFYGLMNMNFKESNQLNKKQALVFSVPFKTFVQKTDLTIKPILLITLKNNTNMVCQIKTIDEVSNSFIIVMANGTGKRQVIQQDSVKQIFEITRLYSLSDDLGIKSIN